MITRTTDLVTPMLSQLTFEGMIDEIYGIKSCTSLVILAALHELTNLPMG